MQIVLNGNSRDFPNLPPTSTLADVVEALALKADRIAVEHNGSIVTRKEWATTAIAEGDKLEVVHFVGGGSTAAYALLALTLLLGGIGTLQATVDPAGSITSQGDGKPTFTVPEIKPGAGLKIVAYGDTRFTDPKNTADAIPGPRKFLVDRIAEEAPDAIFFSGDLPFHGSFAADWLVYQHETEPWRAAHLRFYPTIGNHELVPDPEQGLANYFANFPWLQGRAWYSVHLGNVYLIALDSFLLPEQYAAQRTWLEAQLANLPANADFVFFLSHMPLVTDIQTEVVVSLPTPDAVDLRNFLEAQVAHSHAKFVVVNGHIHNYERFERNGITYLVSGGGGAKPYPVLIRGDQDLYRQRGFPNFHYLVIQVHGKHADVTMHRIANPESTQMKMEVKDTFTMDAK